MRNLNNLLLCSVFMALVSFVQTAQADDCQDSLNRITQAGSVGAEEVLQSLDFSKPHGETPEGLISSIEGRDFDAYMKAELFVLKYLYQRSETISAARIFLERLDALELLNRLFDHPDVFGRQRRVEVSSNFGFNRQKLIALNAVTREAFLLTTLTLANRHPFLILSDERMIPILSECFFGPSQKLQEVPSDPLHNQMVRIQRKLAAARNHETVNLLRGNYLHLSARTKSATDRWSFWLKAVMGSNPGRKEEVRRLIGKLKITLSRENLPKHF